ncbi:maleylpyruvate isomerase family mycothiol-dependent enzyme [Streptomyces sp. LX-29]|uniref:maleylpyruvate isomerase family mycothiol-dependent enzyme n=1 Tax=Streptomyces sp. LX-29 TaxID=2900152 RepID=UPI00240DC964|nr:maleylpyruvate isomerase family mycothiol-dependent enzyme [Streptomyces sp. LX-29]WFB05861.1 maleylpyruvate isomerase family mycothiol-dependent enzyme [Streptomyces sp. LX-29]
MDPLMEQPDTDRLAAGLVAQTTAFAQAVAGADWNAHVPTCPKWRLRVLVAHVGQELRWFAGVVRTREAAPIPDPHDATPPADGEQWLRAGADDLVAAVRATGVDTPVWTFAGPRPARFWLRRATHETTVHRVDAALHAAVPYALPSDLAADAIAEVLELLALPVIESLRPGLAKLRGRGETMRLSATDAEGRSWLVTRTPSGVRWRPGTGPADVEVTGTAQDLLLVLTRRLPPARVAVHGELALLDHWLEHAAL